LLLNSVICYDISRYLSFEKKTTCGLPSSIILEDKHGIAPSIHANISE